MNTPDDFFFVYETFVRIKDNVASIERLDYMDVDLRTYNEMEFNAYFACSLYPLARISADSRFVCGFTNTGKKLFIFQDLNSFEIYEEMPVMLTYYLLSGEERCTKF